MERKKAIRSAYRLTGGNNFYDGMITCSTLSGKAVCRLDYTMSEAGGVTDFVRQYTLASGGPYCDCGYKKGIEKT